jgi:hypothetical protein
MTEETRSWLLSAVEVETGLEEVMVVVVTGLELELMELELDPRLVELLLLMAELTAPDTKGWI